MTIENLSFGRVRLSESSETGSTAIEMTRAEALDLAMALIEAAKPVSGVGAYKSETPGLTRAFLRRCELAEPREEAAG